MTSLTIPNPNDSDDSREADVDPADLEECGGDDNQSESCSDASFSGLRMTRIALVDIGNAAISHLRAKLS